MQKLIQKKMISMMIYLSDILISAVRIGEWLEGYAKVNSTKDDFIFCELKLYVGNRDVLLVNSIFKLRTNKEQKKIIKKRR